MTIALLSNLSPRKRRLLQFSLLAGEVSAVPVQHHADHAAVWGGSADDQLILDPRRAVEVAVEAERAELPVARDVGDAPGGEVAGYLVVVQEGMLGQMLPEQLHGIGEVKHLGGLDLPGNGDRADQVVI